MAHPLIGVTHAPDPCRPPPTGGRADEPDDGSGALRTPAEPGRGDPPNRRTGRCATGQPRPPRLPPGHRAPDADGEPHDLPHRARAGPRCALDLRGPARRRPLRTDRRRALRRGDRHLGTGLVQCRRPDPRLRGLPAALAAA
ncbi:MAG: hypothetical protein GEU96_12755 [Propionibacteriales bacterium]|nr:hypothetical protein [Propionibacteriales bacterium]